MTFRGRLLVAGLIAAWAPLLGLGLSVRSLGVRRLSEASEQRVRDRGDQLAALWREDLSGLDSALDALEVAVREDNDVRRALMTGDESRLQTAVDRFAAASTVALAVILDGDGRTRAASHFPGDVGRRSTGSFGLSGGGGGPFVADVALPDRDMLAVLASREVGVGGASFSLVVGWDLVEMRFVPGEHEASLLAVPLGADSGPGGPRRLVTGSLGPGPTEGHRTLGRVVWKGWGEDREDQAVDLVAIWQDRQLAALVRSYDRVLIVFLAGSAVLTLVLSRGLAGRLSEPIESLARSARRVHLGKLDTRFGRKGGQELERLGYFLNAMLDRLREGLQRTTEAEKRATIGELARQVNHDVRNGIVPIRNVWGHLTEAHAAGPDELAEIFRVRGGTVEDSLEYLGELAEQYRAVAAHGGRGRSDLREIVDSVVASAGTPTGGVRIRCHGPDRAWVDVDAVSLRRIVENALSNGLEAARSTGGFVDVVIEAEAGGGYCLTVSDEGPGIPAGLETRVFEPFFTTRSDGTGLGLAIIRRVVGDVGGTVSIENRAEGGVRLSLSLPGEAVVSGAD